LVPRTPRTPRTPDGVPRTPRLREAGLRLSPGAAIETLASVHLNLIEAGSNPIYTVTRLNDEQREVLEALDFMGLADDEQVTKKITPR